ncbi:MAG: sulfatase-like hydrolase/transferase [Candidatus Sumerlaeota bacterium]|nr:sulfatase-like hydrolase/transferase [Candidatus Sumerlaeota bacterium]
MTDLGLADKTLFVFTSDHGEAFGEHPEAPVWHASTYEEVIRVPLIFSCPALFKPRRVDQQVRLIDVYPTLADLLGMQADRRAQGRSLAPLLRGQDSMAPEPSYSHMSSEGKWHALRT